MPYIRPTKWDANKKPLPGTRWIAQIYFGRDPISGKTLWRSQTFATRKEAKEWAAKTETQRTDGGYRPTLGKTTFGAFLRDTWLPTYRRDKRSWYNTEKTIG